MKELKNYTGDNKKELQELYHSSLVDIRNMEFQYEQLFKLMMEYTLADAILPKTKSKENIRPTLYDHKKRLTTLKPGCDHDFHIPWIGTETEFMPTNLDDPNYTEGEFHTTTYETYCCRFCNGNYYKIIKEEVTPKLDWDVQIDRINQRSRTIIDNSPVRK